MTMAAERGQAGAADERIRRALDVALATVALIVLAPVAAIVAMLILLRLGSPVLFHQARTGLRGTEFSILKFRTMRPPERPGQPDGERETRLGRLLRRMSLDELPQLVNILRGEMSIIGPRPTLPEQVRHYSPRQRRRLDVRPGLTGWAQVRGRNSLSWPERIELDLWYIEHRNVWLDARIVARTVANLLRPRGVIGAGGINPGFPAPEDPQGNTHMLYIVGAGGAGREALDISLALGISVAGFLDDGRSGEVVRGHVVRRPEDANNGADYVVGIAAASPRRRLAALLDARGLRPRTVVHPCAVIAPETTVGPGCIIQANAMVSSNVTIASHCQVHYNATIGHDAVLDEYVTVYPGANVAGGVRLGAGVMLGSNAVILPGLTVGSGAVVGAGAVVTRDVPSGATVVGSPARQRSTVGVA